MCIENIYFILNNFGNKYELLPMIFSNRNGFLEDYNSKITTPVAL